MKTRELYNIIDAFCPKTLSCSWDNDGIMVSPSLDAEVKRVLLSLDATYEAVSYAADYGYDTLITHHPMLFRGAKSVNRDYSIRKKNNPRSFVRRYRDVVPYET